MANNGDEALHSTTWLQQCIKIRHSAQHRNGKKEKEKETQGARDDTRRGEAPRWREIGRAHV